ncbi:Zn(2)-C6 fungal-type domain-containing protein [Fusarium sp. LHS14.1]|nr:Zn(2)-C6 fungal-type domain-containing protein [Fusarium sp. LHS14.1]
MVRHGRRVRRCGTCVERRVKCDEQQPHCQRCKNAGLTCSGYHARLRFVDEGDRFSQSNGSSNPTTNTPPVSIGATANYDAASTSQILTLSPQRSTFFLPYTLSKLSPVVPRSSALVPVGALPRLLECHNSEVHRLCVQAVASTYFGKANRDRQACVQGLHLYSQALKQLQNDLSTASNPRTELGTIMSVLCLCVFENMVFSQPSAWLTHYEGAGRLLQFRGPKAWQNPDERQILRFARYFAILSAGHQRRYCFLDQPQWESIQCLPEGEAPEKIDLLYDIFAETPGIVYDYDQLRQRSCQNSFATRFLRQRVQSVIDRFHARLQTVPWNCSPCSDHDKDGQFPPDDPMNCVALALSYTMLLCLVQPCEFLGLALIRDENTGTELQSGDPFAYKFLALDICRFAEKVLQGQESANLALFLMYPLQIAWFYLQTNNADLTRIRGIMNSAVAGGHGFEIGRMRHKDEFGLDQGRHGFLF